MIQKIEECSLNAWPAERSLLYDGWMLRFAGGYTRRANSISPLFPGNEDINRKIAWCEEQYAAQGLPTIFIITPNIQPDGLDEILAQRGYLREAESAVLYAPLSDIHAVASGCNAVILPQEEWLAHYAHVAGQSSNSQNWHRKILRAIIPAVCPVAIIQDGQPVAVGLGVLERGMVGLYDLVTSEQFRRQGLAAQIIATILSWAAMNGAQCTYLQVMSNNATALALYTKIGYRPCYQYWYRLQQHVTKGV
ncbi:MAG: GNAT family N-acetyltransferase [bacterium]